MAGLLSNSHFLRGLRHGTPFILMAVPFGLLFGVVGTEAGLTAVQAIAFSVIVIAGASQFAAVAQMSDAAPVVIVLLTALAVNMRMAMYSAALAPYLREITRGKRLAAGYVLVDQTYLLSALEFERSHELSANDRFAYFIASFLPSGIIWVLASVVGAYTGALIPPAFALDFVMPIAFLGMIAPAIRTRAHGVAAATSVIMALALHWVPFGMGLILAAIAALAAGSMAELWLERRKP